MQIQNLACLRQVLRRGRVQERRSVVQALRAHANLASAILPSLLLLLKHHSLVLARETADYLQTTFASYAAPEEMVEALIIFSERQRRQQFRADSLQLYRGKLYRNSLLDKGKMKQLERVRQQLKKGIHRVC